MTEITTAGDRVDPENVREKYRLLTKTMIEKKLTVTTMESCTSGQVASLFTDTEGSSAILKGAFITYSNEAKILQGVPEETIDTYGVYSAETAAAMAESCRRTYRADIGLGITGSFGNKDPNNADSIPGEVFFAIAQEGKTHCFHCRIPALDSRLEYKMYMAERAADQLIPLVV